MHSEHYNSATVTLNSVEHVSDPDLCRYIPVIDQILESKVSDEQIVTSVQTVFETLGKPAPTELALGMFYNILAEIPSVFIHQITTDICRGIPNARPIPRDWIDRARERIARLSLLRHAIRKELRRRNPDMTDYGTNIETMILAEEKNEGILSLVK